MTWFPPVFLLVVPDLIQPGLGTSRERQPGMLPGAQGKERGKTAAIKNWRRQKRQAEFVGSSLGSCLSLSHSCVLVPSSPPSFQNSLCSKEESRSEKRDSASQEACPTFPFLVIALGIDFWEWEWKGCYLHILLLALPGPKRNRIKESWNGLG